MNKKPDLKTICRLLQTEIVFIDDVTHTIGVITQVFLHASGGTVLGFRLQLENQAAAVLVAIRYLLFTETPFENEPATAFADSFTQVEQFGTGATTYQDFLGADIVTDEGQLCGQIQEVYFEEASLQTIYEIKRPGLQGFFGKKYFIVGSDSDFYSYRYRRLMLSADAPRYNTLAAAIERLSSAGSPSVLEVESYSQGFPNVRPSRTL